MHEKDVDAEPEAAVVHEAASVDGADPGGWASGSGDAAGTAGDDDRARAMMPCLLLQAAAAQESSGGSSRAQRSNAGFNRHSKAAFESVVGASGGGGSGGKSKPGTSAKAAKRKVQEGGGSGGAGKRIQCESVELRNGGWLDPIDDADFLVGKKVMAKWGGPGNKHHYPAEIIAVNGAAGDLLIGSTTHRVTLGQPI